MKKGFTLIEILAVIVIIGVLAIITIPAVINNIERSQEVAYENLVNNIEQTTQLYIRNNKDDIDGIYTAGNIITITLQDLVDSESLGAPIIDPRNKQEISLFTPVSVLVEPHGKYEVTVGPFGYLSE